MIHAGIKPRGPDRHVAEDRSGQVNARLRMWVAGSLEMALEPGHFSPTRRRRLRRQQQAQLF